jgi:hypothetical protein
MAMLTQNIPGEATAAVTVSPWASGSASDTRFGHVRALVERCMR